MDWWIWALLGAIILIAWRLLADSDKAEREWIERRARKVAPWTDRSDT